MSQFIGTLNPVMKLSYQSQRWLLLTKSRKGCFSYTAGRNINLSAYGQLFPVPQTESEKTGHISILPQTLNKDFSRLAI